MVLELCQLGCYSVELNAPLFLFNFEKNPILLS